MQAGAIMLSNICAAAFFGLCLQLDWGLQVFAHAADRAETERVRAACKFEMPYSSFTAAVKYVTGCSDVCYGCANFDYRSILWAISVISVHECLLQVDRATTTRGRERHVNSQFDSPVYAMRQ